MAKMFSSVLVEISSLLPLLHRIWGHFSGNFQGKIILNQIIFNEVFFSHECISQLRCRKPVRVLFISALEQCTDLPSQCEAESGKGAASPAMKQSSEDYS